MGPDVNKYDVADWFELDIDSPYMLFVSNIKKSKQLKMTQAEMKLFGIEKLNVVRSQIPAVTHVDYTARVQIVHKSTNSRFHGLLKRFKELTSCPILTNTSFNKRGEPIVCSPTDAFRCFMGTNLDVLVIDGFVLRKEDQTDVLREDYRTWYELD